MSSGPDLEAAIAAIDHANAGDPNTIVVGGIERPKELAHSEMMSMWVERLDPDADDLQRLAARAHHLRRWVLARRSFPEGRAGYLRWRVAQRRQHADEVATILITCGYRPDEIARVQQIIRKEGLGTDPAAQTHEDALCLVFVQTQLGELATQLGDDKVVDVVRKTMAKMSAQAIAIATGLPLTATDVRLIERAMAGDSS